MEFNHEISEGEIVINLMNVGKLTKAKEKRAL